MEIYGIFKNNEFVEEFGIFNNLNDVYNKVNNSTDYEVRKGDIDTPKWELSRAEYNDMILDKIQELLTLKPDIKFIEALWELGLITSTAEGIILDRFHEESCETYRCLKN